MGFYIKSMIFRIVTTLRLASLAFFKPIFTYIQSGVILFPSYMRILAGARNGYVYSVCNLSNFLIAAGLFHSYNYRSGGEYCILGPNNGKSPPSQILNFLS